MSKRISRAVLVLSLLVAGLQARTARADSVNSLQDRIVGVWDVQVTVYPCDDLGGTPLGSFRGLHKYELGGTGQVVPSNTVSGYSAHMAVWKHLGGHDYQMTFKMFRFDPAGNNIGWAIVTNEVSISDDGIQYGGSGHAVFYDLGGTSLMTICPTFTGTRFQ